jgi:aspartoacylase
VISNPRAVELNRRYVDFDLNRCCATEDLANPHQAGYERQRAQVLNALFGPKGSADPAYQFLIDLHSTTAHLGPTVIIREDEPLARVIAARVVRDLPEVRVMAYLAEDGTTGGGAANAGGGPGSANRPGDYPYLAEITPHGIEVEVGPVPQGVVRADILIWNERIVNRIVAALDAWNADEDLDIAKELTVFRYVGDSDFPRDETGAMVGTIHPDRQDRDFVPLQHGDPLYLTFDGREVPYEGPSGLVPVFVNEAAYYEKRAALTLAQERTIPVFF